MTRLLASCLLLLSLATGCAMCDNCDDYNYAAQGGKHPRMNMACGRVHSMYDPADGEVVTHEAAPEETQQPTPSTEPSSEPMAPTTTTWRGRWAR